MSGETFEGAKRDAYNMSWWVNSAMTPDYELETGDTLKSLWKNAKQLIKDDPVAAAIQQTFINLVGFPTIRYVSKSERQMKQLNELVKTLNKSITISGDESIVDCIAQIVAWSFADGDILVSLPIDKKRDGVKTVVELVEANRIQTPGNLSKEERENIKLGVHYDSEGRIIGYWVKKLNAMDSGKNNREAYDFFPAYKSINGKKRKVTTLFKAPLNSRPKMSRQYPPLAPVMRNLKNLKDYKEATIIGARVAACFSAFVKTSVPHGTFSGATSDSNGAIYDPLDPNQQRRVQKLQPGTISYLKMNEDISFAAPNRPGDNTDPFIVRQHKEIAAAMRIAYPILFLDLEQTSYSSLRGGSLETVKTINRWRQSLSELLDWIYGTLAYEAILINQVQGKYEGITTSIRWTSNGILDQEKENRAAKLRLENKTASKRLIDEEQGLVYTEIEAERKLEEVEEVHHQAELLKLKKEYEEKYGIVFPDTQKDDRTTGKREGESSDDELSDEEKRKRRKDDGNW